MDQLSHLYMTTGRTIALTIQNFVNKAMSLLFNTMSKFVSIFYHCSTYLFSCQNHIVLFTVFVLEVLKSGNVGFPNSSLILAIQGPPDILYELYNEFFYFWKKKTPHC